MAKKSPPAQWALTPERLSGPQISIATRSPHSHIHVAAWVDDHHIATLEHDGLLRLWRDDATLLAERTISGERPQWTRSITRVRSGLLVHFQHQAWLLDPSTLATIDHGEHIGDLVLAADRLALIDYHGALRILDDADPSLPQTGLLPLAASPQRPYGYTLFAAPDRPLIGLRTPNEGLIIDARDGSLRTLPQGLTLLALHSEGRALLRTAGGLVGLHDLKTLSAVGPLSPAPTDISRAARTASGWLLAEWDARTASSRSLRCMDDQGQEVWRRSGELVQEILPSPDGRRIALLSQRVLVLDASNGALLRGQNLAHYASALQLSHDQLLVMAYERHAHADDTLLASRFNLRGERLGGLSPSLGVACGDTLYGVGWHQGKHMVLTADLRSPELPPTPIAPCRSILTNLTAARGHVYYDNYAAGGAWSLRHAGPDASGAWTDTEIASLKKALPGACVTANDPAGLVAASGGAGPVTVYDAETGSQRWLLLGLTKGRVAACFTPDGAALLAVSSDKLCCWDTSSGEQRWKTKLPQRADRWFTATDAGGERLLLLSQHGALLAYTIATGHLTATAQLDVPELTAIAVGADSRLYLSAVDQLIHVVQLP